jgi:hypothetical protein
MPEQEIVTVPLFALRMLYECAKSYDTRIPQGGHDAWAQPFHDLFRDADPMIEAPAHNRSAPSHRTDRPEGEPPA